MTVDPSNIKSIFLAATEKPPAERAKFLDQAVAGNAALRARVEALLQAHNNQDSFLIEPAAEFGATIDLSPAEPSLAERPGTLIGPYKLLEQIGEGGMGVVYMADQQSPVHRRVALKIIKAGMDTRQVIARFEAERQALALMEHSNIARVLDAGATETGRPYFVMELVRGVPITEYCDQNNLPVYERLELFVQVCHAVQHAHQKGIIHRDIKPSNVLVTVSDGRAVPKVIDFGVAKATGQQLTEKTLFTAFSQMVGTPLYMSPEQAEMTSNDVDTRSDIYSLGVLLYELLTGTTPFDLERIRSAAFDEIRRIIREEEPPKPSTRLSTLGELRTATAAHRQVDPHRLSRLVEGDLDWIVMKALEKDRSRRYDMAGNFAADVMRHLSDQPVEACPPSAAYRFRKFARRNKKSLIIGAITFSLLMLAVGSAGWAVRDRSVRQAALRQGVNAALDDIAASHDREDWTVAMAAVRRAEGLLASSGQTSELGVRVQAWRADLETILRLEDIVLSNADGTQWDSSPAINANYEREFRSLGIDVDGPTVEEVAQRIRAMRIREQLTRALDHWAQFRLNISYDKGKPINPVKWIRRPLTVAAAADPNEFTRRVRLAIEIWDLETLVALTKLPAARDLPISTLRLAARELYFDRGGIYRSTARDILKGAQADHPSDFWINFTIAGHLASLDPKDVDVQSDPIYLDEAIRYATAAMALRPQNAEVRLLLGHTLQRTGRLDDALEVYQKAVQLKPDSASAHVAIGNVLQAQGKFDEAVTALQGALVWNPKDPNVCNALAWMLATSPGVERRPVLALELASQAVEVAPTVGSYWNTLGVARYRVAEYDGAMEALAKSMELREGGDASDWYFVAMAIWQLGDRMQARLWYDLAVEWSDKHQLAGDEASRIRAEATALITEVTATTDKSSPTAVADTSYRNVRLNPEGASLQELLIRNLFRVQPLAPQLDVALKQSEAEANLICTRMGADHADSLAATYGLVRLYGAAGRYADVHRLVSDLPAEFIERKAEATAPLLLSAAKWSGGQMRWQPAADLYHLLIFGPAKSGLPSDPTAVAICYGEYAAVLIELGDRSEYEKLRELAIAQYGDTKKYGIANRLLGICLMLPASERQMESLNKWAAVTVKVSPTKEYRFWYYLSLGLFEYRQGNDERTLQWCEKAQQAEPILPCEARGHALRAMAYARLDQHEQADAELAQCRELIEGKLKGNLADGTYATGFWNDWLFNGTLLREAEALLAGKPAATTPSGGNERSPALQP